MELESDVPALWNAKPSSVRLIRRGRHHVYSMQTERRDVVLKLTPLSVRSYETSCGIAEWVEFLARHRVSVSRAVPSVNGRLVEPLLIDDCEFSACAYVRAPGTPIDFTDHSVWNANLFRRWGRFVGRVHAVSMTYVPAPDVQHHEMSDALIDAIIATMVGKDELRLASAIRDAWSVVAALPRTRDTYGMLHGDANHGNFHIRRGRLTLFDFDDAGRGWFVQDVGMALFGLRYAMMPILAPEEGRVFAQQFFGEFLAGYLAAQPIDREILDALPSLLTLLNLLHFISMRRLPRDQRHVWFPIVQGHALAGTSPLELDLDAAWRAAHQRRKFWSRARA